MIRKIALCALLTAGAAVAQDAPRPAATPQFELVSTVRPSLSDSSSLRIRMDTDAIYIQGASLRDLLANTYGIRTTLIFNLPKWAETERFDIRAKVFSDDPNFLQHMTREKRRIIFERLLKERFGVASHKETRTSPVYELVQIGHGRGLVENPPPPPSAEPEKAKPGHDSRGNTSVFATRLEGTGVRIGDLCANLARILDRSVIDKTGLTSFYDITLTWSDDRTAPPDGSAAAAAPSLFTALQEQLGLKLVSSKGPVEVLVVDKASPPKEID